MVDVKALHILGLEGSCGDQWPATVGNKVSWTALLPDTSVRCIALLPDTGINSTHTLSTSEVTQV